MVGDKVERPWGSFEIIYEGSRYSIKKIIIDTEESISLQYHHHRSEHWVVVEGTASVILDDKEILVNENESIFIKQCSTHRLTNPGKIPLVIIEIQLGEYLGEDDIVRLEDRYDRC